MNHYWMPLTYTVGKPLPHPWRPAKPPPVDQATLCRVLAGLERLTEHQASDHGLSRRSAPGRHRASHGTYQGTALRAALHAQSPTPATLNQNDSA